MVYLFIFILIIIIFFVGFAIGLSIPFLLKKYFDFSKEDKSYILEMKKGYENKFNSIDNSLELINKTIADALKNNSLSSDLYKEYLTGIVSGGDVNESS